MILKKQVNMNQYKKEDQFKWKNVNKEPGSAQ